MPVVSSLLHLLAKPLLYTKLGMVSSNALDSSSPTARSSPVILSEAKDLVWVTIIVTSSVYLHRRLPSEPSCCSQRERQLLPTATMEGNTQGYEVGTLYTGEMASIGVDSSSHRHLLTTFSISSIRMARMIELCNPFLLPINCWYLASCLPYFIAHFCHTWQDTLNALLYRYGEIQLNCGKRQ
jgi:hypothetical protein